MGLEFTRPVAFALLLLVPAFVLIDRHGLRARSAARRYTSLAIRLLGFGLLVFALAAPAFWTGSDTLSTVFLLDRSASVGPAQQQEAIAWIEQAIQAKRPTDRAAVISFAGDAAVEQGLSATPGHVVPNAHLDVSHTDVASALRLAKGVLPSSGARRIVLLTDGNENQGSAVGETQALKAAGIPIDVVPLVATSGPEVSVRAVSLPPAIHQGERFTINVAIDSSVETSGQLRLLVDGQLDSTQPLQLHTGENSLVYSHDPLPPGEHAFQAIVEPARDTLAENNVGYATLQVSGPPRVLLVEGDPGAAKYLAPALQAAGLTVETEAPSILGGNVASLRPYDAIGLLNVPATEIGADGLIALRSYVQDFGGGLVAVGGDRSFGVGAYRNTPLEEALPVSMDVRGRAAHASVLLELVIDVSGSMSEGPVGATKIELAREAALGAIAQLGAQDQLGLLAFDDKNHWIYPTQFLTDRPAVEAAISRLVPGGGTEIYPALQAAYDDAVGRQGKVKHILLMTDGLAPTGDYEGLTARMREQGITLSAIAIGTDADYNLLQNLADWGRGRYYDATNPLELPQFVLKETAEIARAAITEETFTPSVVDQTPILNGITSYPSLLGYVATTPKPSALVGLTSPDHDPILAQWQFGLGRAVAFTSDASARWSATWVSWTDFSHFWGQVFKWAVPAPQGQILQVQSTIVAGRAQIVVDAIGSDGRYVNNATTTAVLAGPSAAAPTDTAAAPPTIPLVQTAPGRYEATVPAAQQGNYLVQVSQTAPGQTTTATQVHGFTVPYSPEFAGLPTDYGFLRDLARRTDGAVLAAPADGFAHNLRLADSARPIWPYLAAALVPLFLLDVAVRRLRFGPGDLQPVLARVRARWLGRTGRAAQLAARLEASRRATRPVVPRPGARPAVVATRAIPRPASRPLATAAAGAGTTTIPSGSRLLAAKRRAAPTPARPRR